MTCTTRETVTRTLGLFRKDGWISTEDSLVTIHQPDACKCFSNCDLPFLRSLPAHFPTPRAMIFIGSSFQVGVHTAYEPSSCLFCCPFPYMLRRNRQNPDSGAATAAATPPSPRPRRRDRQFQRIEDSWSESVNRRDQYGSSWCYLQCLWMSQPMETSRPQSAGRAGDLTG